MTSQVTQCFHQCISLHYLHIKNILPKKHDPMGHHVTQKRGLLDLTPPPKKKKDFSLLNMAPGGLYDPFILKKILERHCFYILPFIMPFCSSDSLVGLDLMKLNSLLRNFPLSRLPSSFELPFRTETKQKPFPAIRKKCLCIFFCINPWYSLRLGIFYSH